MAEKHTGTLSDKVIQLQVKYLQKNRQDPSEFTQRKNELGEEVVLEQDLPVVAEARDAAQQAKENGLLITQEIDPFGTDIDELVVFAVADIHQPGSNPEDSVYNRNKFPYKYIEEFIDRPIGHVMRDAILSLLGKEVAEWGTEVKPTVKVDAFRTTLEAIRNRLLRIRAEETMQADQDKRVKHAIVDFGDRGDTESNMGDVAMTTVEYLDTVGELSDITELQLAMLSGNHDADINNHGFESELFQRELFGRPIFLQIVGGYALLAINTNFYSSFWRFHVEQQRGKFQELEKEVAGNEELSQNAEVQALLERYRDFFDKLATEEQRQQELIQQAFESGKKIAIFAHEEDQVLGNLDLGSAHVTHIVAGHWHKAAQEPTKAKNSKGEAVQLVRMGTFTMTKSGVEWPQSFELRFSGDEMTVADIPVSEQAASMSDLY